MGNIISENSFGYLEIEGSRYAYSVNGHRVNLLPAFVGTEKEPLGIDIFLSSLQKSGGEEDYKYIFGQDENWHRIALLYSGRVYPNFLSLGTSFFSPIMIKSSGNLNGFFGNMSKDWSQYDAIRFSGGIIDSLYNPKIAALKSKSPLANDFDGVHSIQIKPFSEYTHTLSVGINGQKADLMISVSSAIDDNINTTELGSLQSFMQLQFENPQEFITIHKYIEIMKNTLAILARQKNIKFDVSIMQKKENAEYMTTGICKVFFESADFYKPKRLEVVHLQNLLEYLPQMITINTERQADTLLALLPQRNRDRAYISIANVQDLCTALEAEYNLSSLKSSTTKDVAIEKLKKEIKKTIRTFAAEDENIDPNKETTISSCFNYLDLNLKSKILELYNLYKSSIDIVREKHDLPEVTVESIGTFVKLRNKKAHTGKVEWDDSVELYTALLALVYCCFFTRAGVPRDKRDEILIEMFRFA